MNIKMSRAVLSLPPNQHLQVSDGIGTHIVCRHGRIWITQSGDPRDTILEEGGSFDLDRRGPALIQALVDSDLELSASHAVDRSSPLHAIGKTFARRLQHSLERASVMHL